jgi:hypothetical protein
MNEENIDNALSLSELFMNEWKTMLERRRMAQLRVNDLQQIYDTVNGSLHRAKAELEEHERREKIAVDNYEASRGVEA